MQFGFNPQCGSALVGSMCSALLSPAHISLTLSAEMGVRLACLCVIYGILAVYPSLWMVVSWWHAYLCMHGNMLVACPSECG